MLDLLEARVADVLALMDAEALGLPAENAGILVLGQDDLFAVHEDLQGVLLSDVQGATELDGDDDPAQFVNLAYDASGFHMIPSPLLVVKIL